MSIAQVWLQRLRAATRAARPLNDAARSSVAPSAAALLRIPWALLEHQP
jgi:hypothetical protein